MNGPGNDSGGDRSRGDDSGASHSAGDVTETLAALGWRGEFATQLDPSGTDGLHPARVTGLGRGRLEVRGPGVPAAVLTDPGIDIATSIAIGDWVLVDAAHSRAVRVLDRAGVFVRRAAGTDRRSQLIAANVDTLFIVTSANRDFNVARLERYLTVAREGRAQPVVVITKADCNPDAPLLAAEAMKLAPGLIAETVDARSAAAADTLSVWCGSGQTVALVGSSGVGKSTLVNTLTGAGQTTQEVRADDQRGRHTTTARSMHRIAGGGWLIDTPGMRALGLVDSGDAIDDVFEEITSLAGACRFADCTHDAEPGCAVKAAIEAGTVDAARLARYRKLSAESRRNTESLATRRARERSLGKLYKSVIESKSRERPR